MLMLNRLLYQSKGLYLIIIYGLKYELCVTPKHPQGVHPVNSVVFE